MGDRLIKISNFNTKLNSSIGTSFKAFAVYRSKGLLTHLIKRKHFSAAKYIDSLSEIITEPDYAGYTEGTLELVKSFKDNIFISIKLDKKNTKYYVATMFSISMGKLQSYLTSGRLRTIEKTQKNP